MSVHRRGKLVAGVIAAVAALAFVSLPAAAITVTTTAGTLSLRTSAGVLIPPVINLAAPGASCGARVSTMTTSGTYSAGAITTTLRSWSAVRVNGQDFVVDLAITLSGTYSAGPPFYILVSAPGVNQATASVVRSTGQGQCMQLPGAGFCTITASTIAWTGTLFAANASALVPGDEASGVVGGTTALTTVVLGTAANCGTLTALNSGSITFAGVTITA
jgi:hypothetical protein